MEYTISFENKDNNDILKFKWNHFKIVRNCKFDISKVVKILPEYIVLKCDNITFEDDAFLNDYKCLINNVILMQLKVNVYELQDANMGLKLHILLMDYDACIKDLKIKYCNELNIDDILLIRDDFYSETDYLRKGKLYFTAIAAVKVSAIDNLGYTCIINAYENDLISNIKNVLIPKGFAITQKSILMINDKILHGEDELIETGKSNMYIIYVGFIIFPTFESTIFSNIYVNFGTKISHLKSLITTQLNLNSNDISIMKQSQYLSDYRTFGSYEIGELEEIIVVKNIKVFILSSLEKAIEIDVNPDSKIHDLKTKISESFSVNSDKIILSLNKEILSNETAINSLKSADYIMLVMSLSDGERIVMRNDSKEFNSTAKIPLAILNRLPCSPDCDKRFYIQVHQHCLVDTLRAEISRQLKISMCSVDVYHEDRVLLDGGIDEYDIKDSSSLYLKPKLQQRNVEEQFVLNVTSGTDESGRFLIDVYETVHHFKMILRDQYNVNANRIRLFVGNQEMQNRDVIRDLDYIRNGSNVNVVIDRAVEDEPRTICVRVRNSLGKEDDVRDLSLDTSNEVRVLFDQIRLLFGLCAVDYVVCYDGDILKKDMVVSVYGVREGSELVICRSLLVRYVMGGQESCTRVQRYPFTHRDKVSDLKRRIAKNLNMEVQLINLAYNGHSLEGEVLLVDEEIVNESYVTMVAMLSGGASSGVRWR